MKEAHIEHEEKQEQELWDELPGTEGQERAERLLVLAQKAINRSGGKEGLALAEEALKIYKSMGALASDYDTAKAIKHVAYAYKELNRVEEAIKVLDGALHLLRESQAPFLDDTLRQQAIWYSELQKYDKAAELLLEAIRLNEVDGAEDWVAKDLFNLAHVYDEAGKWELVIQSAELARSYYKKTKNVYCVSWCNVNIAHAYTELGDGDLGFIYAQKALDIAQMINDNDLVCKANFVMGMAQIRRGNFDEAEGLLTSAEMFTNANSDWKFLAKIKREYINLYRSSGKIAEAEEVERKLETLLEIVK